MTDPSSDTRQAQPRIRGFEAALPIALLRARAATAHKFKPHTDAEGLSQPQWRVLRALAAGEPLDSKTLAQRCALLQPSLSRIFRSLLDRGLIEDHPTDDYRSRFMKLTPAGQEIFNRVAVISEAVYRDIEHAYGRAELMDLLEKLNRLCAVCDALPDLPIEMPEAGRHPNQRSPR